MRLRLTKPQPVDMILLDGGKESIMNAHLTELTIEVTQKCPNACSFCSSLASPISKQFLNASTVFRIGKEAVNLGLRNVCLSGGEPLCHPEIVSIISGLHAIGLGISFYTTGLTLQHDRIAAPFKDWRVFKDTLTKVVFNIQSTDANVHDRLVGRAGALHLTHESLLCALRTGIEVEVHIVPNLANLPTLKTTVNELASWGVKRVSFLRMVYQGYARQHLDELYLDKATRQHLSKILLDLSQKPPTGLDLRFGIPFSGDVQAVKHCTAACQKLIVRYDGKVLPCEAFKDADDSVFVLGDIATDSLEQMLDRGANNPGLRCLRQKTTSAEPCPAQLLWSSI